MPRINLFLILFSFIVLFYISHSAEQKLSYSKSSSSLRQISPFINKENSRTSIYTSNKKELKNTPQNVRVKSKFDFPAFLKETKDEIIDCFDSVLFAESNKERIDNMCEIAIRHKRLIGTVSAAFILKSMMGRDPVISSSTKLIEDLRRKETLKWGTRFPK